MTIDSGNFTISDWSLNFIVFSVYLIELSSTILLFLRIKEVCHIKMRWIKRILSHQVIIHIWGLHNVNHLSTRNLLPINGWLYYHHFECKPISWEYSFRVFPEEVLLQEKIIRVHLQIAPEYWIREQSSHLCFDRHKVFENIDDQF